jgi:hypothetical protein
MTLIDRLLQLSRLWCAAQDRSASRLATIVANDGKLLGRLEEGKTCTIETFEKFLIFFRESGNWPEGSIPADAAALLDEVEMIAAGGEASVGKELQISAHDLMAPPRSPEWPIASANNGAEIIGADAA